MSLDPHTFHLERQLASLTVIDYEPSRSHLRGRKLFRAVKAGVYDSKTFKLEDLWSRKRQPEEELAGVG